MEGMLSSEVGVKTVVFDLEIPIDTAELMEELKDSGEDLLVDGVLVSGIGVMEDTHEVSTQSAQISGEHHRGLGHSKTFPEISVKLAGAMFAIINEGNAPHKVLLDIMLC